MIAVSPPNWRVELYQAVIESFDREGLELLCFGLNVKLADWKEQTRANKVTSLIEYMEQHQRLNELIDACQRLRSRASWSEIRHMLSQPAPTVPLSERFSVELQPEALSGAGSCEVTIHNEGIQRTLYTVTGHDPASALNFTKGQGRQKIVSPGETKNVNLHITPRKRPLIGRPRLYPFTIHVTTPAHHRQSIHGQVAVKPLLSIKRLPA